MKIVLIGFMGSGKSTIALDISSKCGIENVDTDVMIEENEGITINEIFAEKGEEYFRDLETYTIKELAESDSEMIISVGGGLPVREINRKYLKMAGKVVYLRATVDTLYERLKGDNTRPLLQGEELRNKIETLMNSRSDIYESIADVIIDTDDLTVSEVVKMINPLINKKSS